jgi:hypothetical protein
VLFSKRLKNPVENENKYWKMKPKKYKIKKEKKPRKPELMSQIRNPLSSRHGLNQEGQHMINLMSNDEIEKKNSKYKKFQGKNAIKNKEKIQ